MIATILMGLFLISVLILLFGIFLKNESANIVGSILTVSFGMIIIMTFSDYNTSYARTVAIIEENNRIIKELEKQRNEVKNRLNKTGVLLKYEIKSDGNSGKYVLFNNDKPIESFNMTIASLIQRLNFVEQDLFDARKELQEAYKTKKYLEISPLSGYKIFFNNNGGLIK